MNIPQRIAGPAPKSPMPFLELDLLATLVAISETGSFSAAAEVVFRTPSAISMQVKRIEELLGEQIFHRAARSVAPTESGEMLIAHARRVLALNRDIVAKFVTPDIAGTVRLGALDHAVEQFLPAVLRRFSESHPGITVDVTVENSVPLVEQIRANKLDIALITCFSADAKRDNVETLYDERLVWAGLKSGIAVEQNPLPVSVWEEGCVWRESGLAGLEKQGRDYRITFKSAYISGQKAGILADLAIAPLPISSCEGTIVPLGAEHGLPDLPDYSIGMLINKEATPPVRAVADHMRASFAGGEAATVIASHASKL